MKRLIGGLVVLTAVIVASITAAVAMAAPAPKTTGDIGYTANSVQRHLTFNAIQANTNTCGTLWNVTGVHDINFVYQSVTYHHTATLTQNGLSLLGTGTGGYVPAGVQLNTWVVNAGTGSTVVGNAFSLNATYTDPAEVVGIDLTMSGIIASNGSISGTFTQSGGVLGTFTVPAGSATPTVSYCGKGTALYTDENGLSYLVNVTTVSVSGADAWFAGPVVLSNFGAEGNWLFAKVHDGGEPGKVVDKVWGSFTDQATATSGVAGHLTPADGGATGFAITSGNLQVH